MATSVAIVGASGRMGRLVDRLLSASDEFDVHARLGRDDSLDQLDGADVVLDVSLPAVSPQVVSAALDRRIPIVVGTSGWTSDRLAPVASRLEADQEAPGLTAIFIPNFSLGSALATRPTTSRNRASRAPCSSPPSRSCSPTISKRVTLANGPPSRR